MGSNSLLLRHRSLRAPSSNHQHHYQVRFRWTKAKKKRTARYQRRQVLAAAGKELPKPPYYFPIDTDVVHVIPLQIQQQQKQEQETAFLKQLEQRQQQLQQHLQPQQQQQQQQQQQPSTNEIVPITKPLRFHMKGVVIRNPKVQKLLDLNNGNQSEVIQAQKEQGMFLFQLRPGDTGSSAVQVVALTTRIQQMQRHMASHKKDVHSKRGMNALYVRRRKVLDYMERKDFPMYRNVIKTLGLGR